MATPVACCGFECGAPAGVLQGHTTRSGSVSISTSVVRSGLRSGRTNPSGTTATIGVPFADATSATIREYIRIASHPTANTLIANFLVVGVAGVGLAYDTASQKYYPAEDDTTTVTLGSEGVALALDEWHLLEIALNVSANPWTLDIRLNNVALTRLSIARAANTLAVYHCGTQLRNSTFDVYHDDVLVSRTIGDYPLGPGYVISYIPNADGTHNIAGANDFERSGTGTDITNATTTAFQLVDDRPLEQAAGDYINGVAPPNSTDYVEVQYEDSVEPSPPRSVEAIVGYHSSGSGTNGWTVTLRDHNGGTSATMGSATQGTTGLEWSKTHHTTIPGTANPWTLEAFNALRSRFLVSDAAPDPFIDGLMLEAEYAPALPGALYDRPFGILGKRQMQQLVGS